MILAGVDIGTNSLRLLICETCQGALRELHSDRRTTRLGQGLERTGMLDPDAGERSVQALLDFAEAVRRHGADQWAAIGTSALRNASNSRDFIRTAREMTGFEIQVVSGEEEAELTRLGVLYSLKEAALAAGPSLRSFCIIDIGGGSTEVIIARGEGNPAVVSLPLGAVYLTERFLRDVPPSGVDLARMRAAIRGKLAEGLREQVLPLSCPMIGTAGTITTLASIKLGLATYDSGRITGATLTRGDIDALAGALGTMTRDGRRAVRGLEPAREDIILAGAVITQELMERFHSTTLLVSDGGLREGIVLDLYEKLRIRTD